MWFHSDGRVNTWENIDKTMTKTVDLENSPENFAKFEDILPPSRSFQWGGHGRLSEIQIGIETMMSLSLKGRTSLKFG